MAELNVVIVDDHHLVRKGLREMLEAEPGLVVAGEFESGAEAMTALTDWPCEVLLLDLSLPDVSGLDVLKFVQTHREKIAVLILSSYPEKQFGVSVLRGGARGFISKGASAAELIRAIRTVAKGQKYVSAELTNDLVSTSGGDASQPRHSALSPRELQILVKLAEGTSVHRGRRTDQHQREDGQHLSHAHPGEARLRQQRRSGALRHHQWPDHLMPRLP